jgi:endo-1,3(4)-beta-glucanase
MKIYASTLIGLGVLLQSLQFAGVASQGLGSDSSSFSDDASPVVAPTFVPEPNNTVSVAGEVDAGDGTAALADAAAASSASGAPSNATIGDGASSGFRALEPPGNLVEHTDAMMSLCPPKYIDSSVIKNRAIPTNNWWGNIIAHDSNAFIQPVWSNPYSLQMVVDKAPFGMSVSYPYRSRFSGGSSGNNGANKFYAHGMVREFLFSAEEVAGQKPNFQVVDWADQGVTVKFSSSSGGSMVSDLVSGMVYSSMKYSGLSPRLVATAAISSVNGKPMGGSVSGSKFEIVYNSGQKWVLYALSSDGRSEKEITLVADGNSALKSTGVFDGILRVALVLEDSWLGPLDQHKACIVQAADVDLRDDSAYAFKWKTAGDCAGGLLHFAMKHQAETIDTSGGVRQVDGMVAFSTTRGAYQAFTTPGGSADPVWEMKEAQQVPDDFYPSRKLASSVVQQQRILEHLREDINGAWSIPLDGSYYFNGKAAQKYASLCLMANDAAVVGGDRSLLSTCLDKLRRVMAPFVGNGWSNKLQYDQVYGGIVSSQGFKTKDLNSDFGNTMYNDHHFHYGYWVHTAAIINRLDPSWSDLGKLNAMVELLLRDVANFDAEDKFFARFRSFDWFRGHSYSHGVTPFADGKDQESTSEDVNFAFGMYMYGKATQNAAMEAVGKLMTRVNAHAIKTYFLMEDANQVHPANFKPNKVTGIFFDNKVDYATWFSAEKHCIHGIQMIPVSAVTEFVRTKQFVKEEWEQVLSKEAIVTREDTGNSWLSLLYVNFAAVDKQRSLGVLQKATMDDGLSRSWALYMAASFAE